jgi:hypothetical protein
MQGSTLHAFSLDFEIIGHTKSRIPNSGVCGPLGELSIPRCQFPQLSSILHVSASDAVNIDTLEVGPGTLVDLHQPLQP